MPSSSPIQHSSFDDSNSARLSICSGATLRSSVSSSSPTSPSLQTPKEESFDTRNFQEPEHAPTTAFATLDRASSAPNRRRRTALLLDQPSKLMGNP